MTADHGPVSQRRRIVLATLRGLRALGAFQVARWLTRHRLRILCYHGFSEGDQHIYAPIMFMRPAVFRGRIAVLRRLGVPVVSLGEGLQRLASGTLGRCETVITLDDGWRTTLTHAVPLLRAAGFPSTLYVTTYYVGARQEVFNVAADYVFWKTPATSLRLAGVHPRIDGTYDLTGDKRAVCQNLVTLAQAELSPSARQQFLQLLARELGVAWEDVAGGDRFRLVAADELARIEQSGMGIELHTHRHRMPDVREACLREVEDNRDALEKAIGRRPDHLCFPSGVYRPHHLVWLREAGVVSATTCETGMNGYGADPLLLRRFLDRDDISDLEFEAEVSGVLELARRLRSALDGGGTPQGAYP